MRVRIRLDTLSDVKRFVDITTKVPEKVTLEDGSGYCVSAQSLLGAMASMEWDRICCYCNHDIYTKISDFVLG